MVANFKLFDKVKHKRGYFEGYINAITTNGHMQIKTKDGYEWAYATDLVYQDAAIELKRIDNKSDLRFFNG